MSVVYRKVWRDLWRSKRRTLLVVLSIGVGVFAVGMIAASTAIITESLTNSQRAFTPAHVLLALRGTVDDDTLPVLERIPGVAGIAGAIEARIRWKPSLASEWETATIIARADYAAQMYDRLDLLAGEWPAGETLAVEHNSVDGFGAPAAGVVYFEVNGRAQPVAIAGVLRDPQQFPPPFGRRPAFYATRDMAERLLGQRNFNVLKLRIPEFDEAEAQTSAARVKDRLERMGIPSGVPEIQAPERHFVQDIVDGVNLVLSVMAVLSLGLSIVLVVNTVQAIMAQQVPQIGQMKATGALTSQIVRLYLSGVVIYGALSLALAVPLGAAAGHALARWSLEFFNVPAPDLAFLPRIVLYQLGAGLLTPLLAALWPVLVGASITVREALAAYGLGRGSYGLGVLDRILGRVRGLPRLVTLTVRNTFRRPRRAALTEITLTAAGAIFLMVSSAHASFSHTLDSVLDSLGYDVYVGFKDFQRIEEVDALLAAHPGVAEAEMWVFRPATLRPVGVSAGTVGREAEVLVRAAPRDTRLLAPQLTAGRALRPDDGHALLLNQKLARQMGIGVGDQVFLDLGESGDSVWTVVGLMFDFSARQKAIYVHRDTLLRELHRLGQATTAQIQAIGRERALHKALERDLVDLFAAQGLEVESSGTRGAVRAQVFGEFGVLLFLLLTMAVLIALVGSFGLAGTLSINVIERRREIGVMRAVGASSGDVWLIFVGEGLLLGVLSWGLAVPLSILAGRWFIETLGEVLGFPMIYRFSLPGIVLWLLIVPALALVASGAPARRAARLSVQKSLAYE